jgi:hypothetical protein
MQKVITFEDDGSGGTSQAKGDLPASVMKTVCNEEAGKIVLQFLVSHTRGHSYDFELQRQRCKNLQRK